MQLDNDFIFNPPHGVMHARPYGVASVVRVTLACMRMFNGVGSGSDATDIYPSMGATPSPWHRVHVLRTVDVCHLCPSVTAPCFSLDVPSCKQRSWKDALTPWPLRKHAALRRCCEHLRVYECSRVYMAPVAGLHCPACLELTVHHCFYHHYLIHGHIARTESTRNFASLSLQRSIWYVALHALAMNTIWNGITISLPCKSDKFAVKKATQSQIVRANQEKCWWIPTHVWSEIENKLAS